MKFWSEDEKSCISLTAKLKRPPALKHRIIIYPSEGLLSATQPMSGAQQQQPTFQNFWPVLRLIISLYSSSVGQRKLSLQYISIPWANNSLQGDTFQICYLSPVQLQKLLCENIHSLRMAKSQGSLKADEHHIVCTVDCASLDIRWSKWTVNGNLCTLYKNGNNSDLPEDLVCYR